MDRQKSVRTPIVSSSLQSIYAIEFAFLMSSTELQMKLLIIRFSSFGDILQALSAATAFKEAFPEAQVQWLVRSDFAELLEAQPFLDKVWSFDRKLGLAGLVKTCLQLRRESFTHVYDAHNNLRSFIVSQFVWSSNFIRRPKNRWKRFLLFRLRLNRFPRPFVGQRSFLSPLEPWTESIGLPTAPPLQIPQVVDQKISSLVKNISPFVALAPSSAWPMKNWPIQHWIDMIQSSPETNFVILGGAKDLECVKLANIKRTGSGRTLSLAGQLTWLESCGAIAKSKVLISADTGLLHAADQMGHSAIALIGPTAFGFPARPTSQVLEVSLDCRPCTKDGRGRCHNSVYQRCLLEIRPEIVTAAMKRQFTDTAHT